MHSRTFILAALALAACAPKEKAEAVPVVTLAWSLGGFLSPESMQYDPAQDVYFVSNINGNLSARDNNGFISRVTVDGKVDSLHFIQGGRSGVVLNAPKGMVVKGDTIWVADVDALRAFDSRTGAPLATLDFGVYKVKFLNDVAVGLGGALYVTDTGILVDASGQVSHPGPDRIFSVASNTILTKFEGDGLSSPNGIVWDARHGNFIMAPFGSTSIFVLTLGDSVPTAVAQGAGQFDGVDFLADGRPVVSSWADSSVSVLSGGRFTRLVGGLVSPADISVDRKRNRILVPQLMRDSVKVFEVR
jgi:sugar lactone lactonase YvrE